MSTSPLQTKPDWLSISPKAGTDFTKIKSALRKRGLVTVCEEAHCPNMAECWHNEGTATFMVLGDVCTRGCRFCAIKTAMKGRPVNPHEPHMLAEAISEMGLSYAVLTSVDRDDLPDGGAAHFASCIKEIKTQSPQTYVEVLIGDFAGNHEDLQKIIDANPDVIAHNIEVVERLQRKVRDFRANYKQSLDVLAYVKQVSPHIYTKSALMLGLGETEEEVLQAMDDLRAIDCDFLTIGQYLKPKTSLLEVKEYVMPKIFEQYKFVGEEKGFLYVASGSFVRSSYRAGEFFVMQHKKERERNLS
ncbi:lipoyl synthase [Candidatus Woesearchaeota archaeon]|nr:lipoyl synthase [Candidatus Woesearchaeota archaeon]USN43922.1 MAG: lipoyl synthase [Candidatus Woesearchaeota archaeon]